MIDIESFVVRSDYLKREVLVDFYLPQIRMNPNKKRHLLLVNDGQDLVSMQFERIISSLLGDGQIADVVAVGIHCGAERKLEYGVVGHPDFKGRGSKADLYESFVFNELLPFISEKCDEQWESIGFSGFSLGGLSAFDLVWMHRDTFSVAGIFSGSFWWRSVCQDAPEFDEDKHRIMQQKVKTGKAGGKVKFYFETGTLDEVADRNNNGIIDSIDDTKALIQALTQVAQKSSKKIFFKIFESISLKNTRRGVREKSPIVRIRALICL